MPNIFEEIKPSDLKELANSYVLIEMSFEFALTLGLMQRNDHPMMRVFDAKDPFFMLKYWKLHPCPYSKELDVFVINQVVEVPEDGPLGEKFLQAGLDINHVHNYQGRRRGFRQTALTAFASDYDEINWFRLIWLIQHGADVTFKREEKNNASYHENSFLELILRNIRNEVIRDPEYPNQLTLEDLVDVLIAVKAPVSSLLESARSVVHNAKNLENSSAVLTQLQRLEVCP